jgi:hypothetical protein
LIRRTYPRIADGSSHARSAILRGAPAPACACSTTPANCSAFSTRSIAGTQPSARSKASDARKVARYAERIAATLGRAAVAFARLRKEPTNTRAERVAIRELGRISGYVEDIIRTLEHHLDGRKLAGVKRRLERLAATQPMRDAARSGDVQQIERLLDAEGYFRALADGLRA